MKKWFEKKEIYRKRSYDFRKKNHTLLWIVLLIVAGLIILNVFFQSDGTIEKRLVNETGELEDDWQYANKDYLSTINKLHWYHMPITYYFSTVDTDGSRDCPDFQKERIRKAFNIIKEETDGAVQFQEEDIYGDIFIMCFSTKGSGGYMTEAEAEYINEGNVIVEGNLYFYTHMNCGTWPDVEIHEILHLFGYEHIDDEWSIMTPIAKRCDLGKIDEDIVQDLIETYG